ncbi:ATP-binding protein [Edaphobacter modestus]|uniref:histidine kinase n=1 Tax=Edaphobacter modestus TaxID=388466 RepID=A0A4Q7Z1S8_9BACT|nr:ATP-binding protein [Edaphobacter modestus]RZU43621.1 two-component system OmpR family sensor kinase/two-component system sensor histidine kinase CpxA [Edaphobacter modestus]
MYRLFLTIFLWFWLTAWAMFSIVVLAVHLRGLRQVSAPNMYVTVAPILAAEAVRVYESGGPEAFARFSQSSVSDRERQLYLLDGFDKDVLSRPLTDDGLRVAHAAKTSQVVMLRNDIAAYKFISPLGHPYILMLYLKPGLRKVGDALLGEGLPYTISLILLVTLLCLALAYHIAAPIHSIQSTARRVAQGDLKARVPASVARRFDELSALAKDFDSMVARLELLIQTQKNLLNSVSHELRSPLARINLSVALLKKRYSADSDDMFQRLDRDVARIDLLMGQLLTLSRLEAGLSSAEREDVDLTQLVEEVAADSNFEAEASGKSVSLRTKGLIILENADPHALRSACENVIRNAVRFTRSGTNVKVVLEIDWSTPEPLGILFVRDHGPGVPEESLDAIFQPFYRISCDGQATDGNGLGLAIASEAIRLHRGTISAANLRPTGLEIAIRLPIAFDAASRRYELSQLEHNSTN